MNRTEYGNAVRDMLALEIDRRALLPPDETGYGFDNMADVLAVSPDVDGAIHLAAREISRLAVATRHAAGLSRPITVPGPDAG